MDDIMQTINRVDLKTGGKPVARLRRQRGYTKYDTLLGVIITTYLNVRLTRATKDELGCPEWITFQYDDDTKLFWMGFGLPTTSQEVVRLTGSPENKLSFSCRKWVRDWIIDRDQQDMGNVTGSGVNMYLKYPVLYKGFSSPPYVVCKLGEYELLTDFSG